MRILATVLVVMSSMACAAQETKVTWTSKVTGTELTGTVKVASELPAPLVVYLANLHEAPPRQQVDDQYIEQLKRDGTNVLVLDYNQHPNAAGVKLCEDILKLRTDLTAKENRLILPSVAIDPARIFILPEGYCLLRDVEFARDGERILAMDIAYPANPKKTVPLLMEITCDNQNRMGTSSLLYCRDALLEGAMLNGFAAAMIDHPVRPPYKGLDDPMPQVIHRLKAGVRTARAQSGRCNLNGQIGVMGFSRGGPMAAILAVTNGRADLEGDGLHPGESSEVQAALIHGNRYDYLDLLPDDPMVARFEKAWGLKNSNADKWAAHGAAFFLRENAAPMYLNTSNTESPEYRHGLETFASRLRAISSPHVYQLDDDNRGHRVTTDPAILQKIYDFFTQYLKRD